MRVPLLLSHEFVRGHPADAARILERLPVAEASALLEELPAPAAAAGLRGMVATSGADCLAKMDTRRAAAILGELPADVGSGLLLRLDPEAREAFLAETPAKSAAALRRRLRFRAGTAGALADTRVISFADATTAGEALAQLRRSPPPLYGYLYVVDREERLLGALSLHQLMTAPTRKPLASLMDPRVPRLSAGADWASILAADGWRQAHALPVIDDAGHLLGVVGHETLRRLDRDRGPGAQADGGASLGLAFADLCWIGMAGIVGTVAQAVFRAPPEVAEGGGRHER